MTGSYITQACLELLTPKITSNFWSFGLILSLECWGYRCRSSTLAYELQRVKLQACCMPGKYFTNWAKTPALLPTSFAIILFLVVHFLSLFVCFLGSCKIHRYFFKNKTLTRGLWCIFAFKGEEKDTVPQKSSSGQSWVLVCPGIRFACELTSSSEKQYLLVWGCGLVCRAQAYCAQSPGFHHIK